MSSIHSIRTVVMGPKFLVIADQIIFSATSFLSTLFLARRLGVEGFGGYSAIVLFIYLLVSVSNALITGPYQVVISGREDAGRYTAQVLFLQILLNVILSLLTCVVYLAGASWMKLPEKLLMPLLLMMNGFVLQDMFRKMFIAAGKLKEVVLLDLICSVIFIALLVFSGYRDGLSVETALWCSGSAFLFSAAMGIHMLESRKLEKELIKSTLQWHLSNGRWLLMTSFLQWCSNNLWLAPAGVWVGVAALGALRLSQSLFGILNALMQVLENYAIPKAAGAYRKGKEDLRIFLNLMTKRSMLLLMPILAILLLFPRLILELAGGNTYTSYAYELQGMTILYAVIFFGYPFRIAIRVMLMNKDFFVAYCLSFVFSITLAGYLIREFQLYGVIIALIVNQLLMIAYWYHSLLKKQFVLWR